ncbi:actin interacting protein 3-domain-containing protein [Catenaria anguillulae PL171]|uniref:Actin interacting protein 3-domain-containing protein n=1 Tax=Catenaria anguillulae PL171 TaxID=765915 RepID=A0A1Y2HPQ6_9FUNG|nr:actin interacting protein 3-domain-containing protein [Catenaria anguillulae PL171]
MHAVILGVGDQVRAVLAAQAGQPDDDASETNAGVTNGADGPAASRKVLEHTKSALSVATAGLSDRVLDLDDLVEGIRRDMVSRGAVPSKATLDYAATELDELHRAVDLACSQVEQIRPAWKAVWEQDLRRVVTEQELLDRAESSLDEATQRLDAVAKLTHQLNRVVAIASTNPSAVIPRPRKFDPNAAAVVGEGAEGFEGLQTVLAELSAVLDAETAAAVSERRLRAARRIEKLKQWEREHRRDDFSWELRQFAGVTAATDEPPAGGTTAAETVKPRKLRSTGGVEALERARAAREREVLAAVYQHAKEVKAKQALPSMAQ